MQRMVGECNRAVSAGAPPLLVNGDGLHAEVDGHTVPSGWNNAAVNVAAADAEPKGLFRRTAFLHVDKENRAAWSALRLVSVQLRRWAAFWSNRDVVKADERLNALTLRPFELHDHPLWIKSAVGVNAPQVMRDDRAAVNYYADNARCPATATTTHEGFWTAMVPQIDNTVTVSTG